MSIVSSVPNRWQLRMSDALLWPRMRARSGGWMRGLGVIADQAVVSLASFLATVIVGRYCGQHELGVFGLAVSIFWLAAGIPNALVWTPYTARAAKLPTARRALFAGSTLLHALLVSFAICGALLLLAVLPIGALQQNVWFAPMCLALVPFTIMMTFREHVRRINLAHLQISDLLAIDTPIAVIQIALLLLLANFGSLSANTALLAIAAASGGAIVWLVREQARFRFRPRRAVLHWSHNQRFGRWLLFVSLMWLIGDSSYRWLVVSLHGTESLGQFAAAQNIVLVLNPVLLTVTNLMQALSANWFAEGGARALRQKVARSTLWLAIAAGAPLLVLAAIGGPLVQIVFGDSYAGLGPVVVTLSLGMFARIVAMPIDGAMVALQRGRVMVVAAAVRLIAIVAAGVPLIAWRGLEGVGYAMAASAAAGAIIQWWSLAQGGRNEKC